MRRGVEKCPKNDLTLSADRRPRREPTSGGRDPNYNFPAGTPVADIQELLLRDMILECEEKIRFGCLGTVQVSCRADCLETCVVPVAMGCPLTRIYCRFRTKHKLQD